MAKNSKSSGMVYSGTAPTALRTLKADISAASNPLPKSQLEWLKQRPALVKQAFRPSKSGK